MRWILLVALIAACGGATDESGAHSAAERARREEAASGDKPVEKPSGSSWGGWRYQGSRDDCFFVVGRACFADQDAACHAAKCGKKECTVEGGGPATISCR